MTTAFADFGTMGMTVPGRENDRDGRLRKLNMSDGNTAKIEASDPYGFWKITYEKGKTPSDLKNQQFTSAMQATRFLEIWLNKNRYNTTLVEEPVVIPELPVKKHKVTIEKAA